MTIQHIGLSICHQKGKNSLFVVLNLNLIATTQENLLVNKTAKFYILLF